MKPLCTAALSTLFAALLAVPAFADGEAAEVSSIWSQLLSLARSAGYFLLVMGAIFLCLYATRKIGEKWGKH